MVYQERSQLTHHRIVRRTPAVTGETRIHGWLANIPELETRPRLVEYLRDHKPLRRALFNAANHMENIGLIPDPNIAVEVLSVYWHHVKWRFEVYWKNRLSEDKREDHCLWGELHGTLRNVYRNVLIKCGKAPGSLSFCEYDVQRFY